MSFHHFGRQHGAALMISLLILLILSVLAISSMRGTILQERMVAAQRDGQIALEAAEFALLIAEDDLKSKSNAAALETAFSSLAGYYRSVSKGGGAPFGEEIFVSTNWDDNNSIPVEGYGMIDNMPDAENLRPRYFIEEVSGEAITVGGESSDINVRGYSHQSGEAQAYVFRIVTRGMGRTTEAVRYIESYYLLEL